MTSDAQTLDDLRVEIDQIDDAIHERLLQRAEIVTRLKGFKSDRGAAGALRPAREADILARRLARHRGALPFATVGGIWREIVAASLALQGPFSIAVGADRDAIGIWDLARVHFGSATAMRLCTSATTALDAVVQDQSVFAVLPMPGAGEADPWWPRLAERGGEGPWIVARLPFVEPADAVGPAALLVAHTSFDGGENAVRLAAVPTDFQTAPAHGRGLGAVESGAGYLHLIEVPAAVTDRDGWRPLGGYAPPLRLSGAAEDRS